MRFHSITLRNFRGVEERTVRFDDAVTVVEGPNEVGKSSITEAIRLLRTTKDSSSAGRVKAVKPVHRDAGPEVVLELSTGPYRLRYAKRWLKQPYTELAVLEPTRAQYTGLEAHERFEAILSETVDVGLLDALEVQQGGSLAQASMADLTALQRALGDDPAGDGGDELAARIASEYARWFTATGKKTGEHRQFADAVAERSAEVARLRAESRKVDELTEQHRGAQARLDALRSQLAEATDNEQRSRAAWQALEGLRSAAQDALRRCEQAREANALAEERLRAREDLVRAGEAAQQLQDATTADLAEAEALGKAVNDRLGVAAQALAAAEAAHGSSGDEFRAVGRALAQARAAAELTTLTSRLERARAAEARRRELVAQVESEPVTADTLRTLEDLESEVRATRAAREAAAPVVEVETLGQAPVLLDGAALTDGRHVAPVLDEVRIDVEGVVSVRISPGAARSQLDAAAERAQTALDEALDKLGMATMAEARSAADRRLKAQAAQREAELELGHVLDGDELHTLEAQWEAARVQLGDDDPPAEDVPTLEARWAEAQRAHDAAAEALGEARRENDRQRDAAARQTSRLAVARHAAQDAKSRAERESARLDSARSATSDDALASQRDQSRSVLVEAEALVASTANQLTQAEPDTVEARLTNARGTLESVQRAIEDARAALAGVEALLADRAEQGLFDQLTEAEAALAAADERSERATRAAAAAQLLHETIQRHRAAVQSRYVAPFRERVTALGRLVFGADFEVEVGPDLSIVSRTLDDRTVAFDQLSSGAQEQLALLGRLACAQLVDVDDGAPVILDDALGFADPERLKTMGLALGRVGRDAQIILLTCQPDRYLHVGAAARVAL